MTQITSETAREFFKDDDPSVGYNRLWFNMMRVHRNLYPQIAKALKAHGLADPIWYEILLHIHRGGPTGKLMSQIETELYLPQYALSRHVARLEKAGFVRREFIADGRRKQVLFLTGQGIGLHDEVWTTYHNAMQDALSERLSEDEAYLMARLLIKALPMPWEQKPMQTGDNTD